MKFLFIISFIYSYNEREKKEKNVENASRAE